MTGSRFALVLLLVGALVGGSAIADPATKPVTPPLPKPGPTEHPLKPQTKPSDEKQKDTAKSTTKPSEKLSSPADLIRKYKEQQAAESKKPRVAHFDLDQPVTERAPAFSLFGDNQITIHTLLDRLHQARDDKKLRAVLITFGNTGFSFSQAQEIRGALDELRKSGKRTFVYADAYDTAGYTAASGATDICIPGGGEMMMPGVGLERMCYKGLFGT